jgi:hypothetical protein
LLNKVFEEVVVLRFLVKYFADDSAFTSAVGSIDGNSQAVGLS